MSEKKKRGPKEIIESEENPRLEHGYIKFPGEEMIPAELRVSKDRVDWDYEKMKKEHGKRKRPYALIHTHPYDPSKYRDRKITEASPLPSQEDLRGFLKDDNSKTMAIAQQNQESGKVEGYFILRKTKRTESIGNSPVDSPEEFKNKYFSKGSMRGLKKMFGTFSNIKKIHETTKKYGKLRYLATMLDEPKYLGEAIDKISKKYHLQYRFVPVKGYSTDESKTKFVGKNKGLEERVEMIVFIVGLTTGLILISPTITGNTIANLSIKTTSWIGGSLVLVGLIVSLFWLKSRKREQSQPEKNLI